MHPLPSFPQHLAAHCSVDSRFVREFPSPLLLDTQDWHLKLFSNIQSVTYSMFLGPSRALNNDSHLEHPLRIPGT